jgi:predicted HD superfamily hydrolase involved in NAD metabolism
MPDRAETLARKLCLRLSPARRRHSLAVASLAREMCLTAAVDPALGYLAGLAHDLARELPAPEMLRLAGKRRACSSFELENPLLVHGRAAAALVSAEMCGVNEDVLRALEDHVTGRPGMRTLSKVVFAADYLEPGRDFVSPLVRRRAGRLALDGQVLLVLENVFAWLRAEKRLIAPASLELYEELKAHAQETCPES